MVWCQSPYIFFHVQKTGAQNGIKKKEKEIERGIERKRDRGKKRERENANFGESSLGLPFGHREVATFLFIFPKAVGLMK